MDLTDILIDMDLTDILIDTFMQGIRDEVAVLIKYAEGEMLTEDERPPLRTVESLMEISELLRRMIATSEKLYRDVIQVMLNLDAAIPQRENPAAE